MKETDDRPALTLGRAWEICRVLDEDDARRCADDSARAAALTEPTERERRRAAAW